MVRCENRPCSRSSEQVGHTVELAGIAVVRSASLVFPHLANNLPRFGLDDHRLGMLEHKLFFGQAPMAFLILVGFHLRLKIDGFA